MDCSDVIKNRRQALGMTQTDLGNILHVTRQTVSRWEVGKSYPSLDVLIHLSSVLQVSVDTLLIGENNGMIKDITKKLRNSKRFFWSVMTILIMGISFVGVLTYGRFNQIENIDRFNPFLPTRVAYATLPDKKDYNNSEEFTNSVTSGAIEDGFQSGEWLTFKTGMYTKDDVAMIKHKGSYVSNVTLLDKKYVPNEIKPIMEYGYFKYHRGDPKYYNKIISPFN